MRVVLMMSLWVMVAGCASGAKTVKCDGRLVPINKPAPVTAAASAEKAAPMVKAAAAPAGAGEAP